MTTAGSSLRRTLLAIGALWIPGLGHVVLGRWQMGLLLGALALLALPLAALTMLHAVHPASLVAVLVVAYLPNAVSLVLHLRAQASQPATAPPPRAWAVAFALASLLLSVLIRGACRDHMVQAFRMPSISMEPTFRVGDYLYVDRRASSPRLQHGDVIVFRFPQDRRVKYLKRVIAMGGDQIEIRDRVVILNGTPLIETYAVHTDTLLLPASAGPRDNFPAVHVPTGDVFVMGDQRDNSLDSRYWGFVPESDVLGRVTSTYLSLDPETRAIRWPRIGWSVGQLEALARER